MAEDILPTLLHDGEFAWVFGRVEYGLQRDGERPVSIETAVRLENIETNGSYDHVVDLHFVSDSIIAPYGPAFSIDERNNVTILTNRNLLGQQADPIMQEFSNTGTALRDEPILILDLRGHGGGNDGFAHNWVFQYTGQAPDYGMMFRPARLNSLTVAELNPWMESASPPQWQIWDFDSAHRFIPNENFLIVLIDNSIGSAGDVFVGYLRQLENALFVGANTGGVLVTGNFGNTALPVSGFELGFGTSLNVRTDLSRFEGIGFAPDLWVPPQDGLERILKFIERYEIIKEMP